MKIWGSNMGMREFEGLNTTNRMRQKGRKQKAKIVKKEFKDALKQIYNFNLHNPDATKAEISFVNKDVVPLLEEVGYHLDFKFETDLRFYYTIKWEN